MRPQFFGGMLLTEDDLQAITDYVVGKRRLTNRYVFGTGVVCGLDVSCDPCETGSVVVGPGYAIDCCGNDIVVDCPTQVDVVALVRELRQRSGVDCGEPCEEHPCHEYVLNIVYAEQPTDPVAPYADDDCAVGDCEFSRVREGYRFELSCDPPEAEPSIVDIVTACLDVDDDRVKEDARTMAQVVRTGMAQEARRSEPAVVPDAGKLVIPRSQDFDAHDRDDARLSPAVELVERAVTALARDEAFRADKGPSIGLNTTRRSLISRRTRSLARRLLASDELAARPEPERIRITRLLESADRQKDLLSMAAVAEDSSKDDELDEETYVREAPRMQSRVLRELADSGRSGCREYREVAALKFASLDENAPREVRVLGRNFVSVLVRCVCAAANPPCPTCTDDRVPLARLRVEGCDVTSVCDLERRWVHSPRALAYWFPVVEALRGLLERRCCPDDCDERSPYDRLRKPESSSPYDAASRSAVAADGSVASRVREREVDLLRDEAVSALRRVRPIEDVPELREVLEALGDQFLDRTPPDRGKK